MEEKMEKTARQQKGTFRYARIFLSVTAKEVWEGVRTGRFWLAVFAFLLLLMMDNLPSLYQPILLDGYSEFDTDIATICENSLYGVGFMGYLRFCFYAVPYACSFYDEYSHHAAKYRLVRSSVRVYGTSKMVANIALSALSVLVSELLFVGSLRMQGVKWLQPASALSGALVSSLGKNHPIGYVLFTMAFKCLVAVYFASMVMMLSAFIRSRFVLLASPVALFFCLDSLSALWFASGQQPELTDWRTLFFSLSVNGTVDEAAAFARTGIYTVCFVLLFGVVFVRHLRRVTENE